MIQTTLPLSKTAANMVESPDRTDSPEAPDMNAERGGTVRTGVRAVATFAFLSVVLGLGYTAAVTAVSQAFMPHEANGSVQTVNGRPAGSTLVVPPDTFRGTGLFETRPSAAFAADQGPVSGGSNLALSNPALHEAVRKRAVYWQQKTGRTDAVPQALVTASASGLDPELPRSAALYQIPAVARATGLPERELADLVDSVSRRPFGQLGGESIVNVPKLNLAVMQLKGQNSGLKPPADAGAAPAL